MSELDWRGLVAVGLVAEDLSPAAIARYASVHLAIATEAVEAARDAGLIDADGQVAEAPAIGLVADLSPERAARVHAAVARHLFAAGPDRARDALRHARAAGTLVPLEETVAMADHGGRLSLSLGDYATAHELLDLACELGTLDSPEVQGRRLCDLARAADGLGDVIGALRHLARAVSLGELAGDAALVAAAATQHAVPVDWYSGDPRTTGLLERAEAMDLVHDDRVRVLAARAWAENRIPLSRGAQQLAWVTRPSVAQPLADTALDAAVASGPEARLLALLAWRTTHRAPRFLAARRERSSEALDLAQQLRQPTMQVEAAVLLAVDALESGDRPLADTALAVARWVADRDGNPRLRWRADTLTAGFAHLDGDLEAADAATARAVEVGGRVGVPGVRGTELLFLGQRLASLDDGAALSAVDVPEDDPVLASAIARACVAHQQAFLGRLDAADHHLRIGIRHLDEEGSYLLLATRLSAAAVLVGAQDLIADLIDLLTPWETHVSVDGNAWWCDGPVAAWLALLHHARGDDRTARAALEVAEPVAQALNDVRSLRRIAALGRTLGDRDPVDDLALTAREHDVLRRLAEGATYADIAGALAYSVSTIRNDAVSVYRKLGVRGRLEAVVRADDLGLLDRAREVRH